MCLFVLVVFLYFFGKNLFCVDLRFGIEVVFFFYVFVNMILVNYSLGVDFIGC